MPDSGVSTPLSWARAGDGCIRLTIDARLYPDDIVFRTCYLFTDRCYLFVSETGNHELAVEVRPKTAMSDVGSLAGDFGNELIDQKVRSDLSKETAVLRQLIVTQAFAEADFDGDDEDA